jgi:ankyrin repeat protein
MARCKQLLKRGSKINYINTKNKTPLHIAIEKQLPSKMIQFLLSFGANPHIEDGNKLDCCDKGHELYPEISQLSLENSRRS